MHSCTTAHPEIPLPLSRLPFHPSRGTALPATEPRACPARLPPASIPLLASSPAASRSTATTSSPFDGVLSLAPLWGLCPTGAPSPGRGLHVPTLCPWQGSGRQPGIRWLSNLRATSTLLPVLQGLLSQRAPAPSRGLYWGDTTPTGTALAPCSLLCTQAGTTQASAHPAFPRDRDRRAGWRPAPATPRRAPWAAVALVALGSAHRPQHAVLQRPELGLGARTPPSPPQGQTGVRRQPVTTAARQHRGQLPPPALAF